MLRVVSVIIVAVGLAASASAAQAGVRMARTHCPFAADAAFKVVGARGESDGVTSEYEWLAANRPGWRHDGQALMNNAGKDYDLLNISKGARKQVICFDITDFFGRSGG